MGWICYGLRRREVGENHPRLVAWFALWPLWRLGVVHVVDGLRRSVSSFDIVETDVFHLLCVSHAGSFSLVVVRAGRAMVSCLLFILGSVVHVAFRYVVSDAGVLTGDQVLDGFLSRVALEGEEVGPFPAVGVAAIQQAGRLDDDGSGGERVV